MAVEVPLQPLLEAGIEVFYTRNHSYVTRGANGNLSPECIAAVRKVPSGELIYPHEELAVNVAVQREQAARGFEINDRVEEECVDVALQLLDSPAVDAAAKEQAAGVIASVHAARAEEVAPENPLHKEAEQVGWGTAGHGNGLGSRSNDAGAHGHGRGDT